MVPLILCLLSVAFTGLAAEKSIESACPKLLVEKLSPVYFEVLGDLCYMFAVHDRVFYDRAQYSCDHYGGTLAMPKTKKIDDMIYKKLRTSRIRTEEPLWIGLHDRDREARHYWEDGTAVTYSNFASNTNLLVRGRFEDCIAYNPVDGKWHDYICGGNLLALFSNAKGFICEFPVPETEKTDSEKPEEQPTEGGEETPESGSTEDTCPEFTCDIDCFPDVYARDSNGCDLCECSQQGGSETGETDEPTGSEEGTGTDDAPPECSFDCDLDCFPASYKIGDDGCELCECDV